MLPIQALDNQVKRNLKTIKSVEEFMEDGKGEKCRDDLIQMKAENKTMGALKRSLETMIDHQVLGLNCTYSFLHFQHTQTWHKTLHIQDHTDVVMYAHI
jgi:hypothetical protein